MVVSVRADWLRLSLGAQRMTESRPCASSQAEKRKGGTRTHTLGEVFSALTGNPHVRFDADWSARTIEQLINDLSDLDFVDLSMFLRKKRSRATWTKLDKIRSK